MFPLQINVALAYHDMTCHPSPPPSGAVDSIFIDLGFPVDGEEFNLIVPGVGGATSASCSNAGGDVEPFALPPDSVSAVEHVPGTGQASRYWLFEPTSDAFRNTHIGLSAELPIFNKPDGTPLLTQYRESNLGFVLQTARTFTRGEAFSVATGIIDTWPGATLLEMPASFTLDELLAADPSQFPPYTGMAQVADIASFAVIPEPASACLLTLAVLAWPCNRCHRPARHG